MKKTFKCYLILVSFLVLFLTNCSNKLDPNNSEPDEQVNAFINVNLVPMTHDKVDTNQTVLIDGTKISVIGPSNMITIPDGSMVFDAEGAYMMPGLADMHMHTREDWMDSRWPVSPLNLYLANGVTTIRDFGPSGNDLTYVLRWRDEINEGTRIGPTIYASGLRPGHPSAGNQDPQSIVQWNHAQGFDFLKIYSYISYVDFQAAMATAQQARVITK